MGSWIHDGFLDSQWVPGFIIGLNKSVVYRAQSEVKNKKVHVQIEHPASPLRMQMSWAALMLTDRQKPIWRLGGFQFCKNRGLWSQMIPYGSVLADIEVHIRTVKIYQAQYLF